LDLYETINMNLTIDNILLIGSLLLFTSLLASRTTKYGIPTLLVFLLVGMLAGSDGPIGIYLNDPKLANFIGVIALSFIYHYEKNQNSFKIQNYGLVCANPIRLFREGAEKGGGADNRQV
jgi:hypothetical protein